MGVWGWMVALMVCVLSSNTYTSPLFKQSSAMGSVLGSSAIALRMGSDALSINPAAVNMTLPRLFSMSVGSVYDQQVQNIMLGASIPIHTKLHLLLGVAGQLISDIPETIMLPNGTGARVGSFADISIHSKVGLCVQLMPDWQVAAAMGLMTHQIGNERGSHVSLDLGSYIKMGGIEWGVSLQNGLTNPIQWGSGVQEKTEMGIGVGMGIPLSKGFSIRNGWEWEGGRAIGSAGLLVSLWDDVVIVVGVSDITNRLRPSGGMSLELDRVSIQYGVSSHEQLGLSHRVGMHFMF